MRKTEDGSHADSSSTDLLPAERREFRHLVGLNIASSLSVPLAGLVDTALLGRLPEVRHLAGVALAALIFDYLYFGLGFLRMSTTGQTAQAEGAGRDTAAVLFRSLVVASAFVLAILALHPWIEDLAFGLLGGSPAVEEVGRGYYRARIWGAPGAVLQMALVGWLLGRGRSGAVLATMTAANLTNVALTWWFVAGLGWAAPGAGWASACAQIVGAVVAGALVHRELPSTRTASSWRRALRAPRILDLLRLNAQILGRTLLLVTCFAVFTDASARFGAVLLAANTIVLRWLSVLSYFVDGVAYATETFAGRLWGARQLSRLRSALLHSLTVGTLLGALVWLPVVLLPGPLVGWFTADAGVRASAASAAVWLAPIGLFGSVAYVLDGFFLGLTRGRTLLVAMLPAALGCLALILAGRALGIAPLLWAGMVTLMVGRAVTLGAAAHRVLRLDPT